MFTPHVQAFAFSIVFSVKDIAFSFMGIRDHRNKGGLFSPAS